MTPGPQTGPLQPSGRVTNRNLGMYENVVVAGLVTSLEPRAAARPRTLAKSGSCGNIV